jgi:Leucine-rich repeat (LRR) protein
MTTDLDAHFQDPDIEELDLSTAGPELPDRFDELPKLRRLRLRGDQLTEVPASVFGLTALEELELSGDRFVGLSDDVAKLAELRHLRVRTDNTAFAWPANLKDLGITALTVHGLPVPDDAWKLDLEELHLVRNGREGIYEEIAGLTNLRVFHMQYNPTPELPAWLFDLENLEELDLGFIKLGRCPPEIGKLKKLRHLGMYMGKLLKLPDEIGELGELRILRLTSNDIDALPASLARCTKLEELSFYRNPIEVFPEELFPHPSLKKVDLNSCAKLTTLPAGIGASPRLEELILHFASNVESLKPLEGSISLKKLNLEYCPAGDLEVIGTMTSLEELNLSKRRALEDVSWLAGCTKLKKLDVSDCRAMKKPENALGALVDLEVLEANDSSIKDTAPLAALPRLREVDLSESKVTQPALGESTSIRKLALRECRLKTLEGLPPNLEELSLGWRKLSCPLDPLGALTALKKLELHDAKLEDASALAPLVDLEELDLSENKLEDISFLSGMSKMRVLKLNNNKKLTDIGVVAGMPLRWLTLYGLKKVKDTSMVAAGCDIDGP